VVWGGGQIAHKNSQPSLWLRKENYQLQYGAHASQESQLEKGQNNIRQYITAMSKSDVMIRYNTVHDTTHHIFRSGDTTSKFYAGYT